MLRRHRASNSPRKTIEEVVAGVENSADRREQSGLGRPVPPTVNTVVMGPGVRRDDDVRALPSHRRQDLVAAVIRIKLSAALPADRGAARGG